MGSAFLVLAVVLLAVPGFFVAAKGYSALRRGEVLMNGRRLEGSRARSTGVLLLVYGSLALAAAVVLAAARLR